MGFGFGIFIGLFVMAMLSVVVWAVIRWKRQSVMDEEDDVWLGMCAEEVAEQERKKREVRPAPVEKESPDPEITIEFGESADIPPPSADELELLQLGERAIENLTDCRKYALLQLLKDGGFAESNEAAFLAGCISREFLVGKLKYEFVVGQEPLIVYAFRLRGAVTDVPALKDVVERRNNMGIVALGGALKALAANGTSLAVDYLKRLALGEERTIANWALQAMESNWADTDAFAEFLRQSMSDPEVRLETKGVMSPYVALLPDGKELIKKSLDGTTGE